MRLNTTKRWHKKFKPRVRVWKLKEEQTCEEYKNMVRDKVEEEEWKHLELVSWSLTSLFSTNMAISETRKHLDVNEHWHKMKKITMETAQHSTYVECQKVVADRRKHGGMRRLLKQ